MALNGVEVAANVLQHQAKRTCVYCTTAAMPETILLCVICTPFGSPVMRLLQHTEFGDHPTTADENTCCRED